MVYITVPRDLFPVGAFELVSPRFDDGCYDVGAFEFWCHFSSLGWLAGFPPPEDIVPHLEFSGANFGVDVAFDLPSVIFCPDEGVTPRPHKTRGSYSGPIVLSPQTTTSLYRTLCPHSCAP
ncbi:unnamed protein product [Cuscuta europaea]|uniref:Uncharacterized protein n=1 Tax=Cuscuta europaea TaxID=41803 RepID=A0A9P1E2D7_CUSEU|nr:unnamed protein product [Cuscuta europaea]